MRVAHLITRLILGGAQENTLFNVDDQHYLHGDRVCLITGPGRGPEGSLEQRARDRGLDLRVLPELHRNLRPWKDVQAYRAVKRHLREFKPNLVHTHSSKAGILGRRAAYALGIPAVHTIHGASFHFGQPVLLHAAYKAAERMADRWCHHFITVCDAMTRQYLDAGIGTPDKFTTVFSGMDVDRFLQPSETRGAVRQRFGIREDDVVIVKIARLFHLKGHDYLLKAAPSIVRQVPGARFLLVGDGILREQYERQISDMGLTAHFHFAGLVPPEEVTNYIHAGDMVVHTSDWEGLPRALPQGAIAGLPIVSFDNDGAPEVCISGATGFLVPFRDDVRLAQAIIDLSLDPDLRRRLGEEGRRRFAAPFRHEFMTQCIRAVYSKVLKAASGGGT